MEKTQIEGITTKKERGRIGLLTLDSKSYNYGGLLQEYALLTVVEKMGYECEVIDYEMDSEPGMFSYKRSLRYLTLDKVLNKINGKWTHGQLSDRGNSAEVRNVILNRHARFDEFRKSYMKFSPLCRNEDLQCIQKNYEAVVCGSDQIWNPSMTRPSFFLDFVDSARKKVIYAASISRDSLSAVETRVYKRYISGLDSVSVREEKAKEILHELSPDLDVTVVLDPTLLLDKESWECIAGSRSLVNEPYVFCYFLGVDEKKRAAAINFANKRGIRIVSLPCLLERYNILDEGFSENLFPTGPAEFLSLILHAEYVLTDSFHASVFSIIFGKPFRVFERISGKHSMNSRLETLLGYIGHKEFLTTPESVKTHGIGDSASFDYGMIKEKKDMSMNYLLNRLNGGGIPYVQIIAYCRNNLGDDLFIHIICNRYPDWNFIILCEEEFNKGLADIPNLIIVKKNKAIKGLDKISEAIIGRTNVNCLIARQCVCTVLLGGSVYMQTNPKWESAYEMRKEIQRVSNAFYLLGGNFGPYFSLDFVDKYMHLFGLCADVCFRDRYSYEMFKDVDTVRYAPDIIFSMKKQVTKEKNGGITIIPIQTEKRKELKAFSETYYRAIVDLVREILETGRRVTLQSFCAVEGDQIAVTQILSMLGCKYRDMVYVQHYSGNNLDEILDTINQSEAVVTSRFHGMILGCYFDTKICPIIYSKKMEHFLMDNNYEGFSVKINCMNHIRLCDVLNDRNMVDSTLMKAEANRHFDYLDLALNRYFVTVQP